MQNFLEKLNDTKSHLLSLPDSPIKSDAVAICDHISWCLRQTDTELISDELVKNLSSPITNIYNQRGNPTNVIVYALQVLKVAPLPLNKKRSKSESIKIIDELKAEIQNSKQNLDSISNGFSNSLESNRDELDSLSSDVKKAQEAINAQSTRLDSLVDNAQTAFNQKRSEISEENDTQLSSLRKDLDEERATQKEAYESHLNELLEKLNKMEQEADTRLAKLDTLLGLAGKKSLIADYSQISNSEGWAAFWWSLAASLVLGSGILIGAYIIYKYQIPENMNIPALISRIVLPFSVFVPGFYCAAKARGHREIQIRARNTGVRLNTLEPYLTKLPEGQREEIRAALIEEFFKFKETKNDKLPVFGMSSKSVIELVKGIKDEL